MIDIDLRPASLRHRVAGVKRARIVARSMRDAASLVFSLVIALAYVEVANTRVRAQLGRHGEELRRVATQVSEMNRTNRQIAMRRVARQNADQSAVRFAALLEQLDASLTVGVSFSELRAQGGTVIVRGEVDDVARLRALATELVKRTNVVAFTVESLREALIERGGNVSNFTARLSLVASPR